MPYLKTYNLFISHAWAYGESYHRLVNLLNQAPYSSTRYAGTGLSSIIFCIILYQREKHKRERKNPHVRYYNVQR